MNIIWLTIVAQVLSIAATVIAPMLPIWFPRKPAAQPTLVPDENQPKNRSHNKGGWLIRFFSSPFVFPLAGIVSSISVIPYEIRRANPVTASGVFAISLCVASLFSSMASMAILVINRSIGRLIDLHQKHADTDAGILKIVKLGREIDQLEKKPKRISRAKPPN